jgi:hypothetical protein
MRCNYKMDKLVLKIKKDVKNEKVYKIFKQRIK